MNPTQLLGVLQLASTALSFVQDAAKTYTQVRESLSTDDRSVLDAIYADVLTKSNAVAEQLQAIPDDPES